MKYNTHEFIIGFNTISEEVSRVAKSKGWFISSQPEAIATKIALMHSELSEALETLRDGNPPNNHIPEFSGMEAEFADTIIRIMHVGDRLNLRIADAIIAKLEYNGMREYKHMVGVTRVTSEPGDMTLYDYIIIENYDDYIIAPFGSTFAFPQRLNYFNIVNVETIEDCAKYINDNNLPRTINPYTLMECVNCIKELRK